MGNLPANRFSESANAPLGQVMNLLGDSGLTNLTRVPEQAWNFEKARALKAFGLIDAPSAPPSIESRQGKRIRRHNGLAHAMASGTGSGDAIAETGSNSLGCATAIAEGAGESEAIIAENSFGSATSWTGFEGSAVARVEPGATGSSTATSQREGCSHATVVRNAAGNAACRSRNTGDSRAFACQSGDISLENLGAGPIVVHHYGNADLTVLSNSAVPVRLTNYCRSDLVVRVSKEGEIVIHDGPQSHTHVLTPFTELVEIQESGDVHLLTRSQENDQP